MEAIRKNKKLLDAARRIFGETVIDNAYYSTFYYKDEELKHYMFKLLANPPLDIKESDIYYGGETIVLKFKNGNLVSFYSTEWASISIVNIDSFEKL